MLDPLIVKAISIGLGLMFLLAGYHKLADGAQFRITLLEYQVLPESLVPVASRTIPVVEILLGGAWLLGYYNAGITATASAALLGIYALAIGINIS
ncbi:MAG: MauE/DoxX family redox-associated membrane protein, partial [Woeseiaceae bacterium]